VPKGVSDARSGVDMDILMIPCCICKKIYAVLFDMNPFRNANLLTYVVLYLIGADNIIHHLLLSLSNFWKEKSKILFITHLGRITL
jgi:hypothetical protein